MSSSKQGTWNSQGTTFFDDDGWKEITDWGADGSGNASMRRASTHGVSALATFKLAGKAAESSIRERNQDRKVRKKKLREKTNIGLVEAGLKTFKLPEL
jgi:hypothetical protein